MIGAAIIYALDLPAGLTQVLADETKACLHGSGRVGEEQAGGEAVRRGAFGDQ